MKNRVKAFKFALAGALAMTREVHFRIHLVALALVVIAGLYFDIDSAEWADLLLCSALVISLEAMNSALENLADVAHPDHHPLIKKCKDIAAASVLFAAIFAVVIGLIIFTPHLRFLYA